MGKQCGACDVHVKKDPAHSAIETVEIINRWSHPRRKNHSHSVSRPIVGHIRQLALRATAL